jgi:hypothetical protein
VVKFPGPPTVDDLRAVRPELHTLRSGTTVARIYARSGRYPAAWNHFRFVGPVPTARFDHHAAGEQRGVLYGALLLTTCVAEVFQSTRVVG